MEFTTLLLDLDGTVYSNDSNLWSVIKARINSYMHKEMGIEKEQVVVLQKQYFETYGTTLRGLQANYDIDPYDYLAYVHNVPLGTYIRPDNELNDLLATIKLDKWIFTNADKKHAENVLTHLMMIDQFLGIIDVDTMGFINKPSPEAFKISLEISGEPDPSRCIFIDDSHRNVAAARELGFYSILISDNGDYPEPHHTIPYLKNLRTVMPELWHD